MKPKTYYSLVELSNGKLATLKNECVNVDQLKGILGGCGIKVMFSFRSWGGKMYE